MLVGTFATPHQDNSLQISLYTVFSTHLELQVNIAPLKYTALLYAGKAGCAEI